MKHLRAPLLFVLASTLAACTTTVGDDYFDQVPDEPALSSDEVASLPDGTEVEHAADLQADLAAEQATDDASAYDNDSVDAMVDVEVTDTDPTQPAQTAY